MEFTRADGSQKCRPVEVNHENTFCVPDDEGWTSTFAVDRSTAAEHRASPEYATATLGSVCPYSFGRALSSPLQDWSGSWSTGPWSILSPTENLANGEAQASYYQDRTSETTSSLKPGRILSLISSGAINAEPAYHKTKSDNAMSSDQSCNNRLGLELRPQALSRVAETSRYEVHHDSMLLGLDGFSSRCHSDFDPIGAFAVDHVGYRIGDSLSKSHFYSVEDHRLAQRHNANLGDGKKESSVEFRSGTSPERRHGHQLEARSGGGPKFLSSLSPKDLSQASVTTTCLTSATRSLSMDDSWKCDNCGRVLATKGTKNRNRNIRRHRCPGTAAKYPCPKCPKSFNRGDTRLLHLRKRHPDIRSEPPRPRKRKNLR